jgi:hypothetical protein
MRTDENRKELSMPERRPKVLPKEFAEMRELLLTPPFPYPIQPFIPDTHSAQLNKEIRQSLVVQWTVTPPPGEDFIDVNDTITLDIRVSNTYEHSSGPIQLLKLVPTVRFRDVCLKVTPSGYVKFAAGPDPTLARYYALCVGTNRLTPGQSLSQQVSLIVTGHHVGSNNPEEIANIAVAAKLDLEAFFSYSVNAEAYAQIRNP